MNIIRACVFMVLLLTGQLLHLNAQPFTKKYLMSFHHCANPVCGGPQNHTVHLAESDDGDNWSLLPNFPTYQGSVPDVITRGNKLYIYTPGKVKRYDVLSNQWDAAPVNVSITDSIGNSVQFVDPSAYEDDNGNLCLFFLNSTGITGDPAQCLNPPCTAYFDSATEVAGSDGTQFVKQNGHRIEYTTNSNFKPTDPDIFKSLNTYYQYISYGTGTIVYSCNTLHGTYLQMATLPNGYLTNNNAGIPCGMYQNSNQLFYSYGHRNGANGSEMAWAKHADFTTQPVYNILFTGPGIGLGNVQVASPGICENKFLPTGVHDQKDNDPVQIFPNPNHGTLNVLCSEEIENLTMYDLTGKKIITHLKVAKQTPLLLSGIQAGLYIVQYFDSSHKVYFTKMMVQ